MEKGDEKILSYNDVVLRLSDLSILSGPYFLNDRIIEFYFSHLASLHPSNDILLVPPSIAFWIKECSDRSTLKEFLEPLNLPQRKLIIFPVNDNTDMEEAEGGTHWSLLAFERTSNLFVHHDSSSGGLNIEHSKKVYRAVVSHTSSVGAGYIEFPSSPKQMNGYDCGLYVTAIARAICKWHVGMVRPMDRDGLWFSVVEEQITPSVVSEMRSEILELVRTLMIAQGSSVA